MNDYYGENNCIHRIGTGGSCEECQGWVMVGPRVSERERIATEIERMYGPHDRRFKTAIEIADKIRKS